jgi:hypothetical protein
MSDFPGVSLCHILSIKFSPPPLCSPLRPHLCARRDLFQCPHPTRHRRKPLSTSPSYPMDRRAPDGHGQTKLHEHTSTNRSPSSSAAPSNWRNRSLRPEHSSGYSPALMRASLSRSLPTAFDSRNASTTPRVCPTAEATHPAPRRTIHAPSRARQRLSPFLSTRTSPSRSSSTERLY